jgi:hypothetical protein
MDPRNRSPEEWEREIDRTRAGIDLTLSELRLRLSRGAFMDRIVDSTRAEGAALAAGVGRTLRDNPVPAVVLAAGLAWLLVASRDGGGRLAPVPRRRPDPHLTPHRPPMVDSVEPAAADISDPAVPFDTASGATSDALSGTRTEHPVGTP